MTELSQGLAEVRGAIRHLEQRIDLRFAAIDARFGTIDARFNAVDARFDPLDDKLSRQFVWLVGIVVTAIVAAMGAVISRR